MRTLMAGIGLLVMIVAGIYLAFLDDRPSEETAPEKVKIMLALPTDLEVVQQMVRGAQLAYDQRGGKAGDIPVELVTVNTYNAETPADTSRDVAAAEQAVANEEIIAVLGASNSNRAQATIPILNEAGLPMISCTATQPSLTKPGFVAGQPGSFYPTGQRNFFRVIPSDEVQAGVAARWMQRQNMQTVFIVALDTPYSTGLAGIFEANARDFEIEIVANETIPYEEMSPELISQLAAQIVEANPAAVYYPILRIGNGLDLIAAVLAADEDVIFFGGDGLSGEEGREDHTFPAERIFATNTPSVADLPSASTFVSAYQAAYDIASPHPFAVNCYEAMNVLLDAIAQANPPTRANVLAALGNLGEINGVLGTWHFDTNGDTSLTRLSIMQLKDQAWVSVEVAN